jgi:hypothetical protein
MCSFDPDCPGGPPDFSIEQVRALLDRYANDRIRQILARLSPGGDGGTAAIFNLVGMTQGPSCKCEFNWGDTREAGCEKIALVMIQVECPCGKFRQWACREHLEYLQQMQPPWHPKCKSAAKWWII